MAEITFGDKQINVSEFENSDNSFALILETNWNHIARGSTKERFEIRNLPLPVEQMGIRSESFGRAKKSVLLFGSLKHNITLSGYLNTLTMRGAIVK